MSIAKINANDDGSWSVSSNSEDEALGFVHGLNNCLEHPELDTVEKIEERIAAQEAAEEISED